MPQVASDPIVTRPQRPESLGRAGAPSVQAPSTFKVLLDPPLPPSTPLLDRPAPHNPPDRPERLKPARPDEGNTTNADARTPRDSNARTEAPSHQASADDSSAPQRARDYHPAAKSDSAADAASAAAVDSAGITKAAKDDADAKDTDKTDDKKESTDGGSDPEVTTSSAIASPAGVVSAVITVPTLTDTPTPTTDPAIVAIGAAPPATIGTTDGAAADPSAQTPGAAGDAGADAANPANADGTGDEKTAAGKSVATAAAAQAVAAGTADAKSSAPADHKTETGQPKNPQGDTKVGDAPPADAAQATTANPDAKPAAAHQPRAASPEHMSARSLPSDARTDTAGASTGGTQQASTGAPTPSFNPALPATPLLSAAAPIALRIDSAADNAVPIAGLAIEIVSRAKEGSRSFDIRLDPPELGRIDVRLDVDAGGKVTSRLTVERADTFDLLRRDAPQLERALQHAGLNTEGGLQFSLRDQSFAQRDQTPRNLAPTQLIIPDDEIAATETARRGYGRLIGLGGGVDIKV